MFWNGEEYSGQIAGEICAVQECLQRWGHLPGSTLLREDAQDLLILHPGAVRQQHLLSPPEQVLQRQRAKNSQIALRQGSPDCDG